MRIAVAGGTGQTGTPLAEALRADGHEVVVLARSTGVDLARPVDELVDLLAERLAGVDVVVDVLNTFTMSAAAAEEFFGRTTTALLAAGERAGVGHHVALSINGIDRAPHGYYAGKLRQEALVTAGPLPWTVLRAAQFHGFAGEMLAARTWGPVGVAPRMPVRPVALAEVVEHLAAIAVGAPRRTVLDLVGPRPEELADLARRTARATGGPRWVVGVPVPGALGRAVRAGALLGDAPDLVGRVTFEEWLRARG